MNLPIQLLDVLQEEEMILVLGGSVKPNPNNGNGDCSNNPNTPNNGSGTCSGTNNGDGTCTGTNNNGGVCGGPNNGSGRCSA